MSLSGLLAQRKKRLAKLQKLKDLGINPYPSSAQRTHINYEIMSKYQSLEGKTVYVVGRIMRFRKHGKIAFMHIRDFSGDIQLYLKFEELSGFSKSKQLLGWEQLSLLDIGDFVQACGVVTKTKTGEISVLVHELKILSKSLRPLPDKWHGLENKEARLRRRYLDFTMNPSIREIFVRKAKFWQVTREFLEKKGFMHLDAPFLEHVTGGADARPFETYHNDLHEKLYLRISPELYLKRLIGGGFEKVYSIGPNFRNEGLDDEHLQEYIALEWYWAYANYKDSMKLVKELFLYIAQKVYGKTKFTTRGYTFDLANEWEEIDYKKVIYDKLGIDIYKDSEKKMLNVLYKHGVRLTGEINKNRLVDNLWKIIRKQISGPAFLINEPAFMSPLAKSKPDNPKITERYHVIIAGSELANGYSELNDPIVQYNRMLEQQRMRECGDDEAQMMDIDFVEMLEYGMPTVAGHGHSERLFWYLEDLTAREGTAFPLLKYEISETTKRIYKSAVQYIEKGQQVRNISKQDKYLIIDPRIYSVVPNLRIIRIVCTNINNRIQNALLKELMSMAASIKNNFNLQNIKSKSPFKEWHEIYKSFGTNPNKYKPSLENLYTRIIKSDWIPNINPLVNIYNYLSLKYRLPSGGEDLDAVQGKVSLTFANGTEKVKLLGDKKETICDKDEIIYTDAVGPICRRFNWREADRTKITDSTKNAILVFELLDEGDDLKSVAEEAKTLIKKLCKGNTTYNII